jgi:magnesium-transporting ATPase (P-type)
MQVVLWGRSIYVNVQKFKQFQLTIIVASVIINAVAAASGGVQLNTVQVYSPVSSLTRHKDNCCHPLHSC